MKKLLVFLCVFVAIPIFSGISMAGQYDYTTSGLDSLAHSNYYKWQTTSKSSIQCAF